MLCTPHQNHAGDQIKKTEMWGHVARMGESRGLYSGETWGKEDRGIAGMIILKWILEK